MVRLKVLVQGVILIVLTACLVLLFSFKDHRVTRNASASASLVARLEAPEDVLLREDEPVPLDYQENDLLYRPPLDVALIFTHAKGNLPLQYKLKVAVGSLLRQASAPLRLHLITDEDGFHIASQIINEVQSSNRLDSRYVKLVYVSAEDFIPEIEESVKVLQDYFTTRRHAYYRDALFFFSVHLHRLLPGLEKVILMDIDVKVKGDVAELHSHFNRFSQTNVIGMAYEQSPVYRHLLSLYRRHHPESLLGSPPGEGGFPGYNSGVVLVDIQKLRQSSVIRSYLDKGKLLERSSHYSFQGHLGDQDLYTLIAFDYPDLFYTLPCGWNRQLCDWWKNHGYQTIFDQYFNCTTEFNIIHGNCKTEIPDNL
ncbi:xyloside xylosyltransferase 1 [Macrobrachium rosenbergii]|uniref:xyloside xylosyltransferase 1 n=1 Tax=Macrobrachium rosenbergii TaxID=79674 RepID=UPI0034D65018